MPNISLAYKKELLSALPQFSVYSVFKENSLKNLSLPPTLFSAAFFAILFMDVGSLESNGKSLVFCVEKWAPLAVEQLRINLLSKYKILSNLTNRKVKGVSIGNRISLNSSNLDTFVSLINPFILEGFRYKLLTLKATDRLIPLPQQMVLSQEQTAFIVALIIAKGNSLKPLHHKSSNWSFHFAISSPQHTILSSFAFSLFKEFCQADSFSHYEPTRSGFVTKVHKSFNSLALSFYTSPSLDKKTFPDNISDFVNPTVLFFILIFLKINPFLPLTSPTIALHLDNFDSPSIIRLRTFFITSFNIESSLNNSSLFMNSSTYFTIIKPLTKKYSQLATFFK